MDAEIGWGYGTRMIDFAHSPATTRMGDLTVSRLGFGAMQLPGPMVWGPPRDPDAARAVLRRVVELGIQLIDTSWYYGPNVANELIAEVLHPYAKGLVLVTKLGGRRTDDKGWAPALKPEELRSGCETDLRQLKIERADVVHLRWIDHTDVPFLEAVDTMIALQREGKIRHIGLSNVTPTQLRQAMARTPIVSVSNLYNVAHGEKKLGKLPHAATEGQEEIVDLCAKEGIACLPFFSLAIPGARRRNEALDAVAAKRGATEAQVALAWLLARSPTMVPIPGTSSPKHLEENCASRSLVLTKEEFDAIALARNT